MDYRLVQFSQMTETDIKKLAVLHYAVMHTLLSDLGLPIVWRYYQLAQRDRETVGLCVMTDSGEVVGWAMGSPQPDRITAQLRSHFGWFFLQMLRITLTRPVVLWQLFSSIFSASTQGELKPGTIELTYIGVASGQRGMGLGRKLLGAFIEASRSKGYRSVVLSVEKENVSAFSLYEKAGFKILKTFSEGRYQRHRMELMLA